MMLRCLGLDAGPTHLADGRLAGTCTIYGAGFGCAGRAFPVTDMTSFTGHRQEPAYYTPIQAWAGFVREGRLVVEYLAVAMEGGRTGLIKATDRFRRQ
jgi:hypothetical protein